jgi:tRNA G10  N-methylase Trm11
MINWTKSLWILDTLRVSNNELGGLLMAKKLILDVCCARRMFWFDKHDKRAIFMDKRKESYLHKQKARKDHYIVIEPDVMSDFTNIPCPDNTFHCVIFDPPHIVAEKITGSMHKYYGVLSGEWREMLRKGFSECFRVLKPNGTLVFKWCESSVSLREILALTPEQPVIGNRKPATSKTHFVIFLKQERDT